jgi:hypothetical protein
MIGSGSVVRDGYVWHEIPDPVELRIVPNDGFMRRWIFWKSAKCLLFVLRLC